MKGRAGALCGKRAGPAGPAHGPHLGGVGGPGGPRGGAEASFLDGGSWGCSGFRQFSPGTLVAAKENELCFIAGVLKKGGGGAHGH